ncbi:patatin-like phospholipase family protein [Rubrivirga sp.]|uniref:patatin-like phospholipase family protein n=1 Tax=Rubrivirga sp. TaxID=1885344 RepID=UPI003C7516F2
MPDALQNPNTTYLSPYKGPPRKRRKIALVIGSGGVKCAAAIGLRRVLEREGIRLDLLVGCSGGSLYAATHALGLSLDETENLTRELWTKEVMAKRDTRALFGMAFPKLSKFEGSFGMVDDRPLGKALERAFGETRIEDAKLPLKIAATDFSSGQRVVLEDGLLRDAIRASVAVPFVWRPWPVEGRLLCDGCVSSPMPVDVAIQEGADLILTMGFEAQNPKEISSGLKLAFHVMGVYTNNLYRANYAFHNLAHHAEIVPILPEFDEPVGLFSTHKIPYAVERGEEAAEAAVPFLRRLMAPSA